MSDFTKWSEDEIQQFSHKIEEIIHGPNPSFNQQKIGFAIAIFPLTKDAKLRLLSNVPQQMVEVVLQQILMSFNPMNSPFTGRIQ